MDTPLGSVLYITLGCAKNEVDTDRMRSLLTAAGYEEAFDPQDADIAIVNTCSFLASATSESIETTLELANEVQDGVRSCPIVMCGCVPSRYGDDLPDELPEVAAFVKADEEDGIVAVIDGVLGVEREIAAYIPQVKRTVEGAVAYVKISDGCNRFCSYCIIPFARGRVRSRNSEDVIREVKRLAEHGFREIVLTGIHLSSYGVDTGDDLLHLIREVHNVDGIERIRLGSLEPRIVTDGFAAALAGLSKICPHFHLSLQSGCDATLQRMNRRYDTREYEEGCQILRKYFDHPAITTDVIVGFPGETEEEFAVTKEYLKRIHFYEMHIFQYSKREGTKAAVMEHQVPEPVKKERSNILLALEKKMSEEFREYYVGKQVTALMEEAYEFEGETYFTGYTKEYVKVAFETEENMTNQFVTGKIKGKLKDDIYLLVEF